MGPIVLRGAVSVAKFAPRLVALAKNSPAMVLAAGARLRAAGHSVGTSVGSITAWAKAHPAGATLMATTLASLGLQVSDLFEDPADVATIAGVERGNVAPMDAINYVVAADSSATLALLDSSTKADQNITAAREILSYAVNFFGSKSEATRAHLMIQNFFEMPHADVVFGFDNLKV